MYSNELICNILIYINKNISNQITINDLEKEFYYNRYYIMKLFKNELNITIINYINSIKIFNSILDIKNYNYSIDFISFRNGFNSIQYFSETFKKIIGFKPSTVKAFFKNQNILSEKESDIINNNIINLYEISMLSNKYLSRRKPKVLPTKKLSIFK